MNLKLINRVVDLLLEDSEVEDRGEYAVYSYSLNKDGNRAIDISYDTLTYELEINVYNSLGCFKAELSTHLLKTIIQKLESARGYNDFNE